MTERSICIHGHFYQPPRENPGLEAVELEESAWPWHDWNERITAECYEPNTAARILDGDEWIARILNNFSRISFDAGPTLLSWLEAKRPAVHRALVAADRASAAANDGHGNALAQAYHHAILPLCNSRDKRTQVTWGARDFELRFGRRPAGMWLAETAVDLESLDFLADAGVSFTILAPRQARRVRESPAAPWQDAAALDASRPYRVRLPSGRTIAIFFYDGPLSQAIAFERLLGSGARLLERLAGGFDARAPRTQLVSIAVDGETFGHHHKFGEMALAWTLDAIERGHELGNGARVTNYAAYLARHPPVAEVELIENSSWSCAHGVDRWRGGCDCGIAAGESGAWRAPLRDALDFLRDQTAAPFETEAARFLFDPWAARDAYVDVITRRTPETIEAFFATHARSSLAHGERVRALKLLELERHALHMFTSCGWFFGDVAGLEARLVLGFADRVIQLGEELFGQDLHTQFQARLARAKSNDPRAGDARAVYESKVLPRRVDAKRVAVSAAIGQLFDEPDPTPRGSGFDVAIADVARAANGAAGLATGRLTVSSRVTLEQNAFEFAVARLGTQRVAAGVRSIEPGEPITPGAAGAGGASLHETLGSGDFPRLLAELDQQFPGAVHSLRALLKDDRLRVVERVLEHTVAGVEASLAEIHAEHRPLMRFVHDLAVPLPRAFEVAAEFALHRELKQALDARPVDVLRLRDLVVASRAENVAVDSRDLAFAFERALARVVARAAEQLENVLLLERLQQLVSVGLDFPFGVDLRRVQDLCWHLVTERLPADRKSAARGDVDAVERVARIEALARLVRVREPRP